MQFFSFFSFLLRPESEMILEEKANDRSECMETLVYRPLHQLTDRQLDQFLILARSVGTFARALDGSSAARQPSLHMCAAAASRDVTLVRFCRRSALDFCLFFFYMEELTYIRLNRGVIGTLAFDKHKSNPGIFEKGEGKVRKG